MIEAALYFALGALSISLLLFAILPIVSGRARRLAIHELERQAPVSLSEITAQKDQMRARFAVELNRQEKRGDQLQAETHLHLIDAEKWRAYAERIELDFEKLTRDYAAVKKKISGAELNLQKQKEIAKSALKTMTGQEKKRLFALEEEVDQLRAEKSTASVRVVSLQTELSNAQSRISGMERHMPSLEELSLRKELKALAEDVSQYIRSAPPPAAVPAKPVSAQPVSQQPSANSPAAKPDRPDSALLVKAPPKFPLMTPAIPGAGAYSGSKTETGGPAVPAPQRAAPSGTAAKPQSLTASSVTKSETTVTNALDKIPEVKPAPQQAAFKKDMGNGDSKSRPAAPSENTAKPVPSGVIAAVTGNNKQVFAPQSKNNAELKPGPQPDAQTAVEKPTTGQPVTADTGADSSGKNSPEKTNPEKNKPGTNANGSKPEPALPAAATLAAETTAQQSDKAPQNPRKTVKHDEKARDVKARVVSS
uniref:hypothetical protein n=1 Tax=Pararhizobium sp. IMCC3301 TaxID=3067904 RepID=UPI002741774D|nr:hypothetical protein [Pararhizobium sp. IMCC3301]